MQKLTRSLVMASALAFAGVLAGCGDDVSIEPDPSITLTPTSATLAVGQSAVFSATVSGISNKAVNWASSDVAKATVDGTGKVTAVAAGVTTITATAAGNADVKASAIVTVTNPGKGVQKVEISPTNAILAPGQTLQAVANVTRDPGVAGTVTWLSSAPTIATVGATDGKITAVAAGTATITATSTVDNTVSGAMALTVRAIQQAQISIQSVTQGGTTLPVNFNNVNGQIDVVLNVDPGEERVTKVDVNIDGTSACTRNLSASETEALRIAAAFPEAEAVDIVCSINTADFNATTGVAKYLNGPRILSASATISGPPARTISATDQPVTFTNANTFVATQTFGGTTANATSAAGFAYRRGSISVSLLPVIYNSGQAIAAGNISFGSAACDAAGEGARVAALTAPAAGSSAWTATLSQTGVAGTNNDVSNYEFNGTCAATATGESFTVTATDNAGNTIYAAAPPANFAALAIRLDNRAPGAPTFVANPNSRQNGWINASVGMVGLNTSATDNDWLANGTADAGVGGYVRVVRIGAGPTVDAARADAGSTTPTLPAPSATNLSYCAVISARDLLGNESALPAAASNCSAPPAATFTAVAAQSLSFGVDIAAPTIAFSGGLASNARLNGATVGGEFQVTVTDTGTVGNSGMLSNAAVVGTVGIRNATPASPVCFIGTIVSAVCTPASVNPAPAFPLVPTTTVAAAATTGYYTYSAVAQDAAGNQSAPVTRVIAYDDAANVPALTQALFNTPLNGPTVVFNANASDNFDLRDVTYTLTYAGGLAGPIQYPAVALNAFNATPLVNSNVPAGITINGFLRQIEDVTANGPVAVSGAYKPTALTGVARDQANNSTAPIATGIPGAAVTNGVSYLAATAAQLVNSWAVTNAATNVSTGGGPVAAVNPLTVTLNADAFGPTATFNPPFTRVDFYVLSGGNLVQIGSSTSVSTVDDGSPQGRRHRYSFTWTPGTAFGTAAQTIYAIGVNATGDGLVTPANANITTTNP